MDEGQVAQVRRFNRAVTQRVGALDDSYLSSGRPLGEARVLWEIGEEGCEVRALRSRLGLDSGHASRLLRSLEGAGLVEVAAGARDRRARTARLTPAGLAERVELERRSEELARSFLEPLSARQRERLVAGMREVERLLTAALVEIRQIDPAEPDARQCLRSYFAELERRSGAPFDPTTGSTAEPHEIRPPAGLFLVAFLGDAAIGCGALKHFPGGVTDIKRMWVAESARGLGIGRRLLGELRRARPSTGPRSSAWRRAARWRRRSPSTSRPATSRCRRSTTSPSPTTGSRSGWDGASLLDRPERRPGEDHRRLRISVPVRERRRPARDRSTRRRTRSTTPPCTPRWPARLRRRRMIRGSGPTAGGTRSRGSSRLATGRTRPGVTDSDRPDTRACGFP